MDSEQFEIGDIVMEACDIQKWLVIQIDREFCHLKALHPVALSNFDKRAVNKDDCAKDFLKVGKWDFRKYVELPDVENANGE